MYLTGFLNSYCHPQSITPIVCSEMKTFLFFITVLSCSFLFAFEPSKSTYQGATLGCSSERDIICDIPNNMTGESLLALTRAYYAQHLRNIGTERIFTIAERRVLLYTLYAELCNAAALWTGLICLYDGDEKEFTYACGASSVDECYGYPTDRNAFIALWRRYDMKSFASSSIYQAYVKGMKTVLFDNFRFEGEDRKTKAKVQLPTDVDFVIIRRLLSETALNNTYNFLYLEEKYNKDAVLWDHYWYILKSNNFRKQWSDLRRYYQDINRRLTEYERILEAQANMSHEDVSTMLVAQKLRDEWTKQINEIRARLHRCVYDAPYTLLVTKATHEVVLWLSSSDSQSILSSLGRWFERTDDAVLSCKEIVYYCQSQLTDADDVMANLTTVLAVKQTGRFITVLKMALGSSAYVATMEQSKLLKQMEKIFQ